ncbi:hypothetical protein V5799_007584, partial [Amblyomma americanum]
MRFPSAPLRHLFPVFRRFSEVQYMPLYEPNAQYGCAPGVIRTRVGYTGGTAKDPTYRNLGDHTETIQLEFDPTKTDYKTLLNMFWDFHDPTACHKRQYMSAIFYHDKEQKAIAEESLKRQQSKIKKPIATKIMPAGTFYDAEEYVSSLDNILFGL